MINEEIYVLTKHAKFQADYIENLPVYRRRNYLKLLQEENEKIQAERDKQEAKQKRHR